MAQENSTALFFDVLDRKDGPAFLHTALRAGAVARRLMAIPDHVDPVEGALLLPGGFPYIALGKPRTAADC